MKKSFKQFVSLDSKALYYACCSFTLLVWLWIGSQIPYTHDDWDWGLDIGLSQLLTANINSRYSGNLIIVLITRSRLLKALVYAGVTWLIPFLTSRLVYRHAGKGELEVFLFSNVILLTLHSIIWQQTLGWLSGFANYVTAGLSFVVWYRITRDALLRNGTEMNIKRAVLLFLFMLAAQMFIENFTLYYLAANFCCLIFAYAFKKDWKTFSVFTLAAALGTVIMFSSPSYTSILKTGSSVGRAITVLPGAEITALLSTIYHAFYINLPVAYEINVGLCFGVLLVTLAVLLTDEKKNFLNYAFSLANLFVAVLLCVHDLGYRILPVLERPDGNTHLSIVLFLLIFIENVFLIIRREEKLFFGISLALWSSVFISFLPLTVIKFYGVERLHFTDIIIQSVYVAELYFYLIRSRKIGLRMRQCVTLVLLILMLTSSAEVSNVYRLIGRSDREQRAIIREAVESNAGTIYIPKYSEKEKEFLFVSEPWDDEREEYYKQFYGIPSDTEIVFVDKY